MTRRWEIASLALPNARNKRAKCPQSIPERFRRIPLPRSLVVVLPPVCAHRGFFERLGSGLSWLAGLDGPCHAGTMPTGSPLLRLFGEPAADLRRGAHPHVVFRRLLLVLCHSRFASAVLLMKWNPGTNGPKARDQWTQGQGGKDTLFSLGVKVQACLCRCFAAGRAPTHGAARASCRATLQGAAERARYYSRLASTVMWPCAYVRSSLPQPSVASLPVQTCPRFGMWPDITGASFYSHLGRGTALLGHTAPTRIHFRLDCHGAKKS